MLIVGELINTSRKVIRENVERRNCNYIRDIAKRQVEAGAHYLDVNCSDMLGNELEVMRWLTENIRAVVDVPLCIDTPNPLIMEAGLSLPQNGQPLINSITGEEERYKMMLPLVINHKAGVIALCIDDRGIPESAEETLRVARKLVKKLTESGVPARDIYLDLLVKPLSVSDRAGLEVIDTIRLVKQECPEVHLICGVSNVSYGLPNRKILNRVFAIQTMTMGMDAYMLDPTDKILMGFLYASQALLGQDPFCANYLATHRKGFYQG